MPKVIITMPAYHAEGTLVQTVADIPTGIADELILVDDASSDRTVEVARSMGGINVYVHPRNRGYGGNQKTCYSRALEHDGDIVVMLHPDYQYEPKSVPLLIAPILAGEADMTFGSRFAGLGDPRDGGMPMYRFVGNRITTVIQNLLLGSRFSEMHSGMRAYTRGCLLSLPFLGYSEDFSFDAQFLVDAVTSGQRVVEVPIPTRYTKESSSIGILRSLRYVTTGIGYALMTMIRHGRRGHRNPVVQRSRARGDSKAASASGTPSVDTLLATVDRYVLPTRTVSVVDAVGDPMQATLPRAWNAADQDGTAGVVVVSGSLMAGADPRTAIDKIAKQLVHEGMVAFGPAGADPGTVRGHVSSSGFTMIEWSRAGADVVVARRTG